MPHRLTPELRELQQRVEAAAKEYGLDFFETVYEVLDWEEISEVAAYGGYPARYPHWRFGMEYLELSRSYAYGLSKIYEMVINNDPIYAYLLAANHFMDQKLVMAHVCGHGDFFKHNFMFAGTNRKMVDEMANHASRIRRYAERYGHGEVEALLDRCLSLDNLIDYSPPHDTRVRPAAAPDEEDERPAEPRKLRSKDYMDAYINPAAAMAAERQRLETERARAEAFPARPQKDVLLFLLEHAPLRNWERDVLGMIREEAYYFAPQGRTKIMNEGWASFWHSTLMTERLLAPSELIDYADHHSGTVANHPGQLNPYKLGLELFRDIEERWNTGRHGPTWDAAERYDDRRDWDTGAMRGREKIFEVRRHYNDVTFIDEFLNPEFVRRHGLFTYDYDQRAGQYVISDRDFAVVKEKLLFMMTNFGQPWIEVADGNFLNRGELLLVHRYEGVPLQLDRARDTLENVQRLWKRPVHVETYVHDEPAVLSFDGAEHTLDAAGVDRAESDH
jgi:stage V sporulation protein R